MLSPLIAPEDEGGGHAKPGFFLQSRTFQQLQDCLYWTTQ